MLLRHICDWAPLTAACSSPLTCFAASPGRPRHGASSARSRFRRTPPFERSHVPKLLFHRQVGISPRLPMPYEKIQIVITAEGQQSPCDHGTRAMPTVDHLFGVPVLRQASGRWPRLNSIPVRASMITGALFDSIRWRSSPACMPTFLFECYFDTFVIGRLQRLPGRVFAFLVEIFGTAHPSLLCRDGVLT
jgi:hypothetical protein